MLKDGRARLDGVNFDSDTATIQPGSRSLLDQVARMLSENAAWRVTLEGHTDDVGGAAFNKDFSERRAAVVRAYLVAAGIAPGRLSETGFGLEQPVASNQTQSGRAQNRRVEIVRKYKEEKMRMMIVATAFALAGCGGATPTEGNAASSAAENAAASTKATPAPVPNLPKVTKGEINRLKAGMSYPEVKTLLGREGYLSASERGTQIYAWANLDGSSLQASFKDGKLVDTMDFGIK